MSQRENQAEIEVDITSKAGSSGAAEKRCVTQKKRIMVTFFTEKDQPFFDENWNDWVRRNPPPAGWEKNGWTKKQWAETEMPCVGLLGRMLFRLGL